MHTRRAWQTGWNLSRMLCCKSSHGLFYPCWCKRTVECSALALFTHHWLCWKLVLSGRYTHNLGRSRFSCSVMMLWWGDCQWTQAKAQSTAHDVHDLCWKSISHYSCLFNYNCPILQLPIQLHLLMQHCQWSKHQHILLNDTFAGSCLSLSEAQMQEMIFFAYHDRRAGSHGLQGNKHTVFTLQACSRGTVLTQNTWQHFVNFEKVFVLVSHKTYHDHPSSEAPWPGCQHSRRAGVRKLTFLKLQWDQGRSFDSNFSFGRDKLWASLSHAVRRRKVQLLWGCLTLCRK